MIHLLLGECFNFIRLQKQQQDLSQRETFLLSRHKQARTRRGSVRGFKHHSFGSENLPWLACLSERLVHVKQILTAQSDGGGN